MNENQPTKTRKYKLIVGDMPASPKTKTVERVEPPVEDDGWRQAARGSKPGDRYCRPLELRHTNKVKRSRSPQAGESQTTWARFRAWLQAHRP